MKLQKQHGLAHLMWQVECDILELQKPTGLLTIVPLTRWTAL